jgi:hypothetical protein
LPAGFAFLLAVVKFEAVPGGLSALRLVDEEGEMAAKA